MKGHISFLNQVSTFQLTNIVPILTNKRKLLTNITVNMKAYSIFKANTFFGANLILFLSIHMCRLLLSDCWSLYRLQHQRILNKACDAMEDIIRSYYENREHDRRHKHLCNAWLFKYCKVRSGNGSWIRIWNIIKGWIRIKYLGTHPHYYCKAIFSRLQPYLSCLSLTGRPGMSCQNCFVPVLS